MLNYLISVCISVFNFLWIWKIFFFSLLYRSVDSFISCLQNIVRNRCSSDETAFRIISNSLYQNVLPKCFPYSNSNKASKENLFDKTYVDSAGNNVKNKSDKVILYQHVEDRHSNGNIEFINFFCLFCVFLPMLQFSMYDYIFPSWLFLFKKRVEYFCA